MSYRTGQAIECPKCGQSATVKVVSRMDGWTKIGEYYACTLCHAELADRDVAAEEQHREGRRSAAANQLASFLGTSKDQIGPVISDDGERRFCRDCTHYLVHPFVSRCMLHDRPTKPMDDCGDFVRRATAGTEAAE